MKSELVSIDSLSLDPANVRRHPEKNLKAIIASLKRFGQQKPIVVDPKGIVIAGNGTLQAAKQLGYKEIAVVRSPLSGSEATAYAIADNRTSELAEWDDDSLAEQLAALQIEDEELALATGFDEKEIDDLLSPDDVTEDDVPEPPVDPITKPGDLWLLGEHRLLCGDSTNTEDMNRLMRGDRSHCVFTSPPYAVGLDYGDTYEDSISNLRKMLPLLSKMWKDIIDENGFAVINFGDIAPAAKIAQTEQPCEYPMSLEYWPVFRADGWRLWSRRIWCKPNARTHSLQCISSNRAATDWEHIWTWTRAANPRLRRIDGQMRSCLGWLDTSSMDGVELGKTVHGAGMAISIAVWMLNVHTLTGDIVHEPFCGTGTTLIAAEQLGRKCYGMEISPAYCDVIVKRWETLTGKKATLANS